MTGKKNLSRMAAVVLAGLAMFFFTACGGQYDEANQGASGGAVSGQAVSGSAVSDGAADGEQTENEKEEKKKYVPENMKMDFSSLSTYNFANSTNFYMCDDESSIVQYTLEGKKGAVYEKDTDYEIGLAAVTEEGVYYVNDDGEKLIKIPIHKGKDGTDVMETENQEVILNLKNEVDGIYEFEGVCMTGDYVYYVSDNAVVKYNWKQKKEISRAVGGDGGAHLLGCVGSQVYAAYSVDEEDLTLSDHMCIITQNAESDEWKEVLQTYDYEVEMDDSHARAEDGIYMNVLGKEGKELGLELLDADGRAHILVQDKEYRELLAQSGVVVSPASVNEFSSWGVFLSDGKVYQNVRVGVGTASKSAVFSYDPAIGELGLEKELMNQTMTVEEDDEGNKGTRLWTICNGKALYSDYENKHRFWCRDMKSGRKKKLTEKDPEYYMYTYANWDCMGRELWEDFE